MKNIATTVNVSFKYPITEKKLSALIKSGTVEQKYLPHIFSFFTDVPTTDILFFIKKFHIPLLLLKKYYINYVKDLYPNKELEEVFTYE